MNRRRFLRTARALAGRHRRDDFRLPASSLERPLRLPLRIEYHETGHSLARGIEWTARPLGRDTLLAAVDADGNPVEATLSRLEPFRRSEPVLGANSRALVGGRLRERFEPFGSRVWRLVG